MALMSFAGWSADESVSRSFSRVMKATTSPWGALVDPPLVAMATAPLFLGYLGARQTGGSEALVLALAVFTAAPIALGIGLFLGLSTARKQVVAWLAGLPFPVDNMNAILNGVGDFAEIHFRDGMPDEKQLNAELDAVHTDAFVTEYDPENKVALVRLGVVDDKRNPARSNHTRYQRVRAIVERVLVPTATSFPIAGVYLK